MKKLILTSALFASMLSFGQKEIPTNIKEAVYKTFPNAQNVGWEIENGNYEAKFTDGDYQRSLLFNKDAKVLETETKISVVDLPVRIVQYVTTAYKGLKISEAARIIDSSGVVTFEAEVNGKDLIFNDEGAFLRIAK